MTIIQYFFLGAQIALLVVGTREKKIQYVVASLICCVLSLIAGLSTILFLHP